MRVDFSRSWPATSLELEILRVLARRLRLFLMICVSLRRLGPDGSLLPPVSLHVCVFCRSVRAHRACSRFLLLGLRLEKRSSRLLLQVLPRLALLRHRLLLPGPSRSLGLQIGAGDSCRETLPLLPCSVLRL